ncbi:hypothetical protein RvY_00737 [Ramazzottius varieornatus]|uniref:Transferrin receptor-like dimerisation domain-containing protein n=1 Tax=Ramazzottius varieornatus TaxID=947166 RepID=A0A1D1UHG8_RAMVA|nr:hypothetical protein RvY_00737 [Ramazzottius varieornatus]
MAVGKIWGEIVRDIADSAVVPFSVTDMAEYMNVSWHQVRQDILAENTTETPYDFGPEIDFDGMNLAIGEFEKSAQAFDDDAKQAATDGRQKSDLLMRQLNDKLIKLDRMFVLPEGLPGRPLYRHVLHAPSKSNAYGGASFPGIVDCVASVLQARKKNDQSEELKWLNELKLHSTKVIQLIDRAARFLSPTFSGLYQSP